MGSNHQDRNDQDKALQHHQVAVVVVPFPAQGHLNQAIQLSRILSSYNLPIHYVGASVHNRQARERIHWWDPHSTANLHFHDFQVPFFTSPPPNPNSDTKFPSHLQPSFNASSHLREPVATLLRSLSAKFRRVVVIYDSLMASVVQDVVYLHNTEPYVFHSSSAFMLLAYIWEAMGKPFDDGIFSREWNVPSIEGCFSREFLNFMAGQHDFAMLQRGALYNTSRAIEAPYLDLLAREEINGRKKQWAIGPLNPVNISQGMKPNDEKQRNRCLKWLDQQNPNSVIFVSFGSTTCMQDEQILELAIGLLKSEQKFIWVLRDADKGNVYERENEENYVGRVFELPKGYEESVKDRGLIVREWAPQLEILAHPSTGGFMSHCGWNSCMESISNGVPIAAWPMHSDQPRNTVLVTQVLKIGVVVRDWDHREEIVRSGSIENVVRNLMASKEGDDIRKRAEKLGFDVRRSVEDGGASRLELDSFVAHITR
ncbi:UDP-glucuronosyl/UDP-glucosyltransferase [Dillenia turbinata]|uniref:Glycosyltransferase n=1 Tax=Dillenia turbinata TaxID=194707 RepID=A0AAN8W561_9MAGN